MLSESECIQCKRLFDNYQQYLNPMLSESLLSFLRPKTEGVLLDLGVGPGYLASEVMKRSDFRVVGLDINPVMLKLASDQAKLWSHIDRMHFVQGDAHVLPFPGESFDGVYSFSCMHHWDRPEIVLQECLRVLRPGGKFVIWDVLPDATQSVSKTLDAVIPDKECRDILKKALQEALPMDHVANLFLHSRFENSQLEIFRFSEEQIVNSIDLLTSSGLSIEHLPSAGNCWWFTGRKGGDFRAN